MSIVNDSKHGVLMRGNSRPLVDSAYTGGGTIERLYVTTTGGIAIGVFIRSVTGTVDIKGYTAGKGDRAEELEIVTFPTITVPTTEIMLRHSPKALSFIRLEITYSDAVDLLVTAQTVDAVHALQNVREEVKTAPDSVCTVSYADIGTLNERITSIAYTAPSVPNTTVTKTITYVLNAGVYTPTVVTWSVT